MPPPTERLAQPAENSAPTLCSHWAPFRTGSSTPWLLPALSVLVHGCAVGTWWGLIPLTALAVPLPWATRWQQVPVPAATRLPGLPGQRLFSKGAEVSCFALVSPLSKVSVWSWTRWQYDFSGKGNFLYCGQHRIDAVVKSVLYKRYLRQSCCLNTVCFFSFRNTCFQS